MPCLKIEISFWNLWESQKLKYIRFSAEKITYIPNRNLEKKFSLISPWVFTIENLNESLGKEKKILIDLSMISSRDSLRRFFWDSQILNIFIFNFFKRNMRFSMRFSPEKKHKYLKQKFSKIIFSRRYLVDISLGCLTWESQWDARLRN